MEEKERSSGESKGVSNIHCSLLLSMKLNICRPFSITSLQVDPSKEGLITQHLQQVTAEEIKRVFQAQKEDKEAFRRREKLEWPIQEDF